MLVLSVLVTLYIQLNKILEVYWIKFGNSLIWLLIEDDVRRFELNMIDSFITSFFFLRNYYILNDLIWLDGFLIDFLQKKVVDKWVRKFLIFSAYLFNERVVFDYLVRFYIDLVIWPTYRKTIYEFNNVSSTILITVLLLLVIFLTIVLLYFGIFIFNM